MRNPRIESREPSSTVPITPLLQYSTPPIPSLHFPKPSPATESRSSQVYPCRRNAIPRRTQENPAILSYCRGTTIKIKIPPAPPSTGQAPGRPRPPARVSCTELLLLPPFPSQYSKTPRPLSKLRCAPTSGRKRTVPLCPASAALCSLVQPKSPGDEKKLLEREGRRQEPEDRRKAERREEPRKRPEKA